MTEDELNAQVEAELNAQIDAELQPSWRASAWRLRGGCVARLR
jgi:hypothetical protein